MNMMEYAHAEGFVKTFYFQRPDGRLGSRTATLTSAEASMKNTESGCYLTVFGKYTFKLDDNFYLDYGILVNDVVEAEKQGLAWICEQTEIGNEFKANATSLLGVA